jgi:hypothetical protein
VIQGIAIIWLLSLADLGFTLWAHSFTPFDELNPIAAALLDEGLLGMLVTMKVGLTFVGAAIFWYLRGHGRAELAMWAVVLAYVLLTIRWSSYTAGVMALAGASV